MDIYESYLKRKRLSQASIKAYKHTIQHFIEWLESEYLNLKICRSADIMAYLQLLKQSGNQNKTMAHKLRAISLLFESMDILPNPAAVLQIKGINKGVPTHLLTQKELDALYKNHPNESIFEKRDKVIIGLIIYQGISKGSLMKLSIEDVQSSFISVPSSKRSNPRRLPIADVQKELLEKYTTQIRCQIMQQPSDLFIVSQRSNKPRGIIEQAMRRLKVQHPKVQTISQLRGSRIAIWLKTHNLRQVQQMAGHRYVSSTERYQMQYLEDLQKDLVKYHPRK